MGHRDRRHPAGAALTDPALPGPRVVALAALVCAVSVGAMVLVVRDAPASFALVNLAALAMAIALALAPWGRAEAVFWATPAFMGATLIAGSSLGGVTRWLALGPMSVHVGMAMLPGFAVLAAHRQGWATTAAVAVVAGILAVQPDRGTGIAFAAAMVANALLRRSQWSVLSAACAVIAAAITLIRPDPLAPVTHVENVLQDLAGNTVPLAVVAALALLAAIAAPLRSAATGAALTAFFAGLAIASLIGAYPTPLLGYGVAPIIGYGLAVGLIEGGRRSQASG